MEYNITDDTFKLVERADDTFYTVQILEDPYKDVKYQYGNVRIKVDEEDYEETARLMFTWQLVEGDDALIEDGEFQEYIGRILQFIIEDNLNSGNYRIGDNDDDSDTTDNDTEEPAK